MKGSCLAAFVLFVVLLFDPAGAAAGVTEGLSLALGRAIPALFPFFVASSLVVETGGAAWLGRIFARPVRMLFGLPGAAASALVLGLSGGYPVGARTVRELYDRGLLQKTDAERALACCNNTGPGFLIGLCGVSLLGSVSAGVLLYSIHLLSALLVGMVLARGTTDEISTAAPTIPSPSFAVCFLACVERAGKTALRVTGFITVFSMLLRLLRGRGMVDWLARLLIPLCPLLGIPETAAQALVLGGLELTCGIASLPANLGNQLLPILSFLVGFGGLSVWCQSAAVLAGSDLSLRPCLWGKCLHGVLAAAIATIVIHWLPQPLPTAAIGVLDANPSAMPGFFFLFLSFLLPFISGKKGRHPV